MFDPGQKRNQRRQEKRARKHLNETCDLPSKHNCKFVKPEQTKKEKNTPSPRNPELENIRRFKAGSNHFVYQKGD